MNNTIFTTPSPPAVREWVVEFWPLAWYAALAVVGFAGGFLSVLSR